MNKRIVVLGDVHGRVDLLNKFLDKFDPSDYFIVQLGDLNDNTMKDIEVSSTECIEIMMTLVGNKEAEVLYSNHHDKLYRYLNGNPIKPSHGMDRTINEVEKDWDAEFQGTVHKWLHERPMYYEFEINGLKHVCVHAFMDDLVYSRKDNHNTMKGYRWFVSQCIYGPNDDGKRAEWWNEPNIDNAITQFHLICGHYHLNMRKPNFTICDTDDHSLCYYVPDTREMGLIR